MKKNPFLRGVASSSQLGYVQADSSVRLDETSPGDSGRNNTNRYILEEDIILEEKKEKEEEVPLGVEKDDPDFIELLSLAHDDVSSWDNAGTGDNVTVYKKMTEDSPIVMLKAYALIEGVQPETVFEVMSN